MASAAAAAIGRFVQLFGGMMSQKQSFVSLCALKRRLEEAPPEDLPDLYDNPLKRLGLANLRHQHPETLTFHLHSAATSAM